MENFLFLKDFGNVIFNCVDRNSNKLVDLCANYAICSDFIWDEISSNKVPPSFINLLKEEFVGISH